MKKHPLGKTSWVIAGGHIPAESTGPEPACTSFDQLCVLNTAERVAKLEITIYYAHLDPVGPYCLEVPGRRVRHVRFNDFIDPQAIPLDKEYAAVISADVPVVVQFTRQDTSQGAKALMGMIAYPAE